MQIIFSAFLVFIFGIIVSKADKSVIGNQKNEFQALNFTIMNKGESIRIPLQNIFSYSQGYSVYDHQSSASIQNILNISFSLDKYQNQTSQPMQAKLTNNQTIFLNESKIMDIKTIYNQPNKLFLLQNNIIMMYSYRQKSQSNQFYMNQKAEKYHSLLKEHIQKRQKYQNFQRQEKQNDRQNIKEDKSNDFKRQKKGDSIDPFLKVTVYNISSYVQISGVKNYNFSCLQMQALPLQAQYKLIILCKLTTNSASQNRNYIVTFNMQQSNKGFITNLKYNSSNYIEGLKASQKNEGQILQEIDQMNGQQQDVQNEFSSFDKSKGPSLCLEYHLKYFNELNIIERPQKQTVVVYCNSSVDTNPSREVYQIFFNSKVIINKIPYNPIIMYNLTTCLINSKYVTEFENGFISIKSQSKSIVNWYRMYKYSHKINSKGKVETQCKQYNYVNLYEYQFITSRNQSGIETIYVIKPEEILIFQSYSPNYQTLKINPLNISLVSYAISNQILSLHFQNKIRGNIVLEAYNIKSMYPHLIDRIQYRFGGIDPGIYLFSVMNYLQKGNYFFIYQRDINILNLTYYTGQYVNITINDPAKAVGMQKVAIINSTKTNISPLPPNISLLPINLKIRAFCDTSIETVKIPQIKLNSKLFNIDLVKAVIGPLGRFYKMPNSQSSLQFVNSFHEIDITNILNRFSNKKLMTFSIDNFLNLPIMTFYFENSFFLKCDLQFDFYSMRPMITRCLEIIDNQKEERKPQQIIIYAQDKFIQHETLWIYFCHIDASKDTTCILGDSELKEIKKIKLIKCTSIDQNYELISVFIIFDHSFKQKDYKIKINPTSSSDIQIFMNVEITSNEIEYLKDMTIRTVEYDEGYENFLVLYIMNYFNPVYKQGEDQSQSKEQRQNSTQNDLKATYFHIIQIYSKPQLQPNQSSHFIGHLISQFVSTQLDNVFIIDNKIILLSINPSGSNIEEYQIIDFRCIKVRNYPLYDHIIAKNGSHAINSGFLFVQVQDLEQEVTKYLVYNPSMNTTNIITHSFEKINDEKLLFIQKITPSQNVMAIHGNKLIALSLPNIVVKLNDNKRVEQNQLQKNRNSLQHYNPKKNKQTKHFANYNPFQKNKLATRVQDLSHSDSLNVSFIDNNDILRLLSFNYSYDLSDSKIQYLETIQNPDTFKSISSNFSIYIDPTQIIGPVSEYSIINFTESSPMEMIEDSPPDICHFIEFNSSDIFTKTRCIKYFNSKQDGIMQDFLIYESGLFQDITIIVTDKKVLCIQDMNITSQLPKNKTKDCNIFEEDSRIFIICTESNGTTMNMLEMSQKCQFQLQWLPKPQFLKYNLFNMMYSRGQAIFEVPIRSKTNFIYYLTQFDINTKKFNQISENAMLLKHQSQEQFSTQDFQVNEGFMFLLQNGLGIFNLSKRNNETKKVVPDDWISKEQLMQKFGLQEQLTYVNCLYFDIHSSVIILEIGTSLHSFETHFLYEINNISFSINILQITVNYIYKNPWSCYNTLLSKSRYYKNMTIKMCSFQPQQYYVFSNFIPISQNKQNSYIIFYQKNFLTNISYPFRMDIIYTNIYSNDNFQIPKSKAKLLIGSLFNLLCQYDLKDKFSFNFKVNQKILDFVNDSKDFRLEKWCNFSLNLSNQNYEATSKFAIKMDFETKNREYWTDWKHWIQRVVFIIIIINFIRLEYNKRTQRNRVSKLKVKRDRSGSFDQEFDIQVRFLSKKSL